MSHSAFIAVSPWGRLGVPEGWRYNANQDTASVWLRREDGTYTAIDHGEGQPAPKSADIEEPMQRGDSPGTSRGYAQVREWTRDVLVPRRGVAR